MDDDSSTDAILKALASPQRRIVLGALAAESSPAVSVDALEEVVARELAGPPTGQQSPSEIAIRLRHVHLPRLATAGLCTYDPDRECVEYRENEFVERLLEFIEERPRPDRLH